MCTNNLFKKSSSHKHKKRENKLIIFINHIQLKQKRVNWTVSVNSRVSCLLYNLKNIEQITYLVLLCLLHLSSIGQTINDKTVLGKELHEIYRFD
jgi:hypothetical protein